MKNAQRIAHSAQLKCSFFMVWESIKHFPIPLRKSPKVIARGDFLVIFILTFCLYNPLHAQDAQPAPGAAAPAAVEPPKAAVLVNVSAKDGAPSKAGNVTLDFKDADISNILKIISYKSGVNIVTTPEVVGNATVRLVDVPWENALDVILKTYGFGYQRQGNIILVTKLENMAKIQSEEPLKTEIFTLKFLDALDAQKILIPLLSPRGKISVLYERGQKGWKFGTFKIGPEGTGSSPELAKIGNEAALEAISYEQSKTGEITQRKAEFEPSIKSKVLIITDTISSLDRIRGAIIPEIDKKPKQVLIETRIVEVNLDKLRDIGFDWGTGTGGANGYTTAPVDISIGSGKKSVAGRNLASEFTPSKFDPLEGTTDFPGTYPYKAGLEVLFKQLAGTQLEVIIHALEEDASTNTLSAPRILTLDNQEASILVGYHRPILKTDITTDSSSTSAAKITQTLHYYQEIGIRLNVVPQVSDEGYINMIIHPSVTSSSSNVTATSFAGTTPITTTYPIIDVREAQTQVFIKDGATVVLGGLLKDVQSKENIGIPFLRKIPYIGKFFDREIIDNSKVDLLIFITARVVKENDFSVEEIARLEQELSRQVKVELKSKKDKKAKGKK